MSIASVLGNLGFNAESSPALASAQSGGEGFSNILAKTMDGSGSTFGERSVGKLILQNQNITKATAWDGPFGQGLGRAGLRDVALDLAQAHLPESYKSQLGMSLMALGREGSSLNSMSAGADLMGCHTSLDALKGIVDSLGGEGALLQLDEDALPALGEILADSGFDNESINEFISDLAGGEMTVDDLQLALTKLENNMPTGGALKATTEGLPAFGQFLSSLGASSEIVKQVTSSFQPGDSITSEDLRQIFNSDNSGFLNGQMSDGDLDNLFQSLKSMGLNDRDLKSLFNVLKQGQGHTSINDFLNALGSLEKTPANGIAAGDMDLIKTVMQNISREDEMAKTPVFNETLTKLQALGDREIDDRFMKMSPALQALRGGFTGGEMDLGGQGGFGGQGRNAQEERSQIMQNIHTQGVSFAAQVEAAESVQNFGGQESLARQISQKMVYSQRRGLNRLKMKLNPENLGALDIELRMKGDKLTANLKAASQEAFDALAGEMGSLKDALAESGLDVNNLSLSYNGQTMNTKDAGLQEQAGLGAAEQISPELAAEFIAANMNYDGRLNQLV